MLQRIQKNTAYQLLSQTWNSWNEDRAPRLGAALAYYTVFSMAPLLIVCIAIAGLVFDKAQARAEILNQMTQTMGAGASETVGKMLDGANNRQGSGTLAIIIGLGTAFAGAAGLFGQLQDSLNTIWGVKLKPLPFLEMLKNRFISFAMVFGIGFFLLVSLALSAAISALTRFLPEGWVAQSSNVLISFFVTMLLFAMIFRVLPDAEVQWRDVWIGATLTAVLFTVGKFALGWYLGRQATNSIYGPAASLVLILLWVYYAAQILFFGAEFTKVYANAYGSKIKPSKDAVAVTAEARAEQGLEPTPAIAAVHGAPSRSNRKGAPPVAASNGTRPASPTSGETPTTSERKPRTPGTFDDIASVVMGLGLAYVLHRWREGRKAKARANRDPR